jgi:hypothetical protein
MKSLLMLALVLGFSQAHAAETFKNRKMTKAQVKEFLARQLGQRGSGRSPGNPGPNPIPLQPIRYGKAKAEVFKSVVKKEGDGSYTVSISQVCILQGVAPVFDERGISGPISYPNTPLPKCVTTVDNQPAEVEAGGYFTLQTSLIFTNEQPTDVKMGIFQIKTVQSSMVISMAGNMGMTREINAKSMIGMTGTPSFTVCQDDGTGDMECTSLEGEFFSANVELVD